MHVVVLGELEEPLLARPSLRGQVAQLDRPVEIAVVPTHGDRLGDPRSASASSFAGPRVRTRSRARSETENVSSVCSVHRVARPLASSASTSSAPPARGTVPASTLSAARIVLELHQHEASAEPDPSAVLVRRGEVERAREQVVRLLDRERIPARSAAPSRYPRAASMSPASRQ